MRKWFGTIQIICETYRPSLTDDEIETRSAEYDDMEARVEALLEQIALPGWRLTVAGSDAKAER